MKKLCIFTLYPERGASSKYRIFLYKEILESKFDVKWFPFWNDVYVSKYMHFKKKHIVAIMLLYIVALVKRLYQLLVIAPKSDVCFFQKACIPKFRYNNIARLKKKGVRIVFDVDDAIYLEKADFSSEIAKLSDVVTCGNSTLYQYYEKFNPNVVLLPTVENTGLYKAYWKECFENKIIGWIGSLSTIDNLDIVVDPINKIVEKYPNVSFVIISNSALDYNKKIKNCKLIKWSQESYISDLSNITVGIMPLKNNEVNKGKCGFKLIQYLNLKKPVIASDVGVNKEIVGECGILANSAQEWFDAFETILMDEKKYSNFEDKINEEFFCKYSFDLNSQRLLSILSEEKE